MGKSNKRFKKVYSQGIGLEVFVDCETGVNYLFNSGGFSVTMLALLDKNGKPLVTEIPYEREYDGKE